MSPWQFETEGATWKIYTHLPQIVLRLKSETEHQSFVCLFVILCSDWSEGFDAFPVTWVHIDAHLLVP